MQCIEYTKILHLIFQSFLKVNSLKLKLRGIIEYPNTVVWSDTKI